MNRREFVRGSVLCCAGASLALPAFADTERRVSFRLDGHQEFTMLRSFLFDDPLNAVDSLTLPPSKSLIQHSSLPVLFMPLELDVWQHRSRSAVGAVQFCSLTGRFKRHDVKPLSLGAIGIMRVAVVENEARLIVDTATGIRNVFCLNEDGGLGDLVSVRKTLLPLTRQVQARI
jgi:hypothetical protein